MEIRFQNLGPENWQADIAIALCCEKENPVEQYPDLDKLCPWLAISPAMRDFTGKKGSQAVLYGHPDLKAPRLLLAGLGPRREVTLDDIRGAMGNAARRCRELGIKSTLLPASILDKFPSGRDRLIEECVYSFSLGLYRFITYKTKRDDLIPDPEWLAIGLDGQDEGARQAAEKGANAAWAVCNARDLDNQPGNHLYPENFALAAVELAQQYGFLCSVFNESALESMGAGCLLAVGQGSSHPPRLIALEYAPEGHEQEKPLIFVGKGITFDSGGLCLKPAANMWQMKCDMSGAGAVLSVIAAAAREGIKRRLVGILACAENMPDGAAYRPGDILSALNGESVEVINTDAEGRLALADGLAYAQQKYSPCAIIDIATLTGACAVALGTGLAGLFCADDSFAHRIAAYGAACGENFWRLPLWQPYAESLKSEVADIKHTASREGGAISAALFLENFVEQGQLWAHLDIAGVDWAAKSTSLCVEGATGFGCRCLLELARGGVA